MADNSRSISVATGFECAYYRRKFTKKEHLKVRAPSNSSLAGPHTLVPSRDTKDPVGSWLPFRSKDPARH